MSKLIDLIGQKFGRLIVIRYVGKNKWRHSRWLCQCDCGKEIIVSGNDLKSDNTKSCGCLNIEKIIERSTKHGHRKDGTITKFYMVWNAMIQRCINHKNKAYKNYGGRGITVCDEWLIFENFNKNMGKSWKPGLTLERDRNELGYFKGNCYWATRTEQNRNKRNNRLITCFGKTQCIAAWAEETGIPAPTIRKRLKLGWPLERALTEPIKKRRK